MSIAVRVKGKHLEMTDGLREYAQQKLQRLEKYFGNIREAIVIESIDGNMHRVEVTLEGDGMLLRGEERTNDMYVSVDRVVDKLEQRLKKFKAKHTHLRNHQDSLRTNVSPSNGVGIDGILPAESEPEVDDRPRIVRTKAVTMKPMDLDDAVQMLELTDHDWFVYLDSTTNQTQVVYRRRDGNYGLVVPKI
ncbi:MAG: ribosome hibernation-promoting factor, HPF/YfiA family [Capsulimonadaceae bacterium]